MTMVERMARTRRVVIREDARWKSGDRKPDAGKGGRPAELVVARGLGQVGGANEIGKLVDQAIDANPKSVQDFLAGKQAAAQSLVGQVMKLSRGKADPQLVGKMVAERLAAMKLATEK